MTSVENVTGLSEASGATFCVQVDAGKLTNPLQAQIISGCSNASFTVKSFGSAMSIAAQQAFPSALEQYVTDKISTSEFLSLLNQ